jgi:hypothetical protein
VTADGQKLTDPDLLLFRQIHPAHYPDGRISSGAFVPGPNHNSLLSVRHESIGARRAYEEFVAAGIKSLGTWAVSVVEVESNPESDGISAYLDELIDGRPEAHVSIDFTPSPSRGATKRIARHLARRAESRGCQYRPGEPE